MKIKLIIAIFLLLVSIGIIGVTSKIKNKSLPSETSLSNIRIGWQIPWATQGQLTQILKHTDILKKNGLNGDFKGFSSGAPLNEAALSGAVDVMFTADQPAATLLSKDTGWVIVGRLMYNRVSLYVPPKSIIENVADLRGKTVGMPFGAAAQRMALQAEKDAGLDPENDVNNVNLDIYAQSDLVRDPNALKWGTMDALAGFDPTPAILEEKGLIRNLAVGKVTSVILMSKDYIKLNPKAPEDFLKALYEAYDFYRSNVTQADAWFIADSRLTITTKSLQLAASMEPNLDTRSKNIRLGFVEDDYKALQDAANFIYERSLVKQRVDMRSHINLSYLKSANLR